MSYSARLKAKMAQKKPWFPIWVNPFSMFDQLYSLVTKLARVYGEKIHKGRGEWLGAVSSASMHISRHLVMGADEAKVNEAYDYYYNALKE